jgi:hypothetical protein
MNVDDEVKRLLALGPAELGEGAPMLATTPHEIPIVGSPSYFDCKTGKFRQEKSE